MGILQDYERELQAGFDGLRQLERWKWEIDEFFRTFISPFKHIQLHGLMSRETRIVKEGNSEIFVGWELSALASSPPEPSGPYQLAVVFWPDGRSEDSAARSHHVGRFVLPAEYVWPVRKNLAEVLYSIEQLLPAKEYPHFCERREGLEKFAKWHNVG